MSRILGKFTVSLQLWCHVTRFLQPTVFTTGYCYLGRAEADEYYQNHVPLWNDVTDEHKLPFLINRISLSIRLGRPILVPDIMQSRLTRTVSKEYHKYSLKKNFKVQPKRPLIDILQVHLHPLFKLNFISTADLPNTGESGFQA